jgi:galactose-1-phosphate uridylyltransferase
MAQMPPSPSSPSGSPAFNAERRIERLPELIAALPARERELAARLFQVSVTRGEIVPPAGMEPWLERTFGSVEATRHQTIVRVINRWTYEGAIFNPLRSRRPGSGTTPSNASPASPPQGGEGARGRGAAGEVALAPELRERIEAAAGDDFCHPLERTPADTFGRVQGRHVVTAANVAKAEGWHSVGIFDRHNPLAIDEALVADVLDVAGTWAGRAREVDPDARYLFLLWNALWRAGASLVHGHVQMALSPVAAQAKVTLWRDAARRYQAATGGDYFADLAAAHRALGLAAEGGKLDWFASLTPVKEREVDVLAPTYHDATLDPAELGVMAEPLWHTLRVALEVMGVRAFNAVIFGPPLGGAAPGWEGFPLVARFVDRGNPLSPTSDIAGLELFGTSVVATDPFDVARDLRAATATDAEEEPRA